MKDYAYNKKKSHESHEIKGSILVTYFLKDEEETRQVDATGLCQHIIYSGGIKGEFSVKSLGCKINWNALTGIVSSNLVTQEKPNITHFLPAEALYPHIALVGSAMRCFVKKELLIGLAKLNDPLLLDVIGTKILNRNPDINNINDIDDINNIEKKLDKVIIKIKEIGTPLQKRQHKLLNWLIVGNKNEKPSDIHIAIYEGFLNYERKNRQEIILISCLNHVHGILNELNGMFAKMKMVR